MVGAASERSTWSNRRVPGSSILRRREFTYRPSTGLEAVSAQESIFIVPSKKLGIRSIHNPFRKLKRLAMQPTILVSVVEHLFDFIANDKTKICIHRRIARVEYAVNILPQKDAI